MPTNLGHEAISALKAGHSSVTAAYAGHQQIFPNTTTIQSAAFTNTSAMSNAGGSRIFRVAGDVGSTFNLNGTGNYIITVSPYDHTVNVGSNNSCDDPARTITTTLTPTGNTILQGGGSSFTDSFSQNAGPSTNNYTASISISATNTNYVTTTVGCNLYWAAGAQWSVSYSYSGAYASHAYISTFGSGTWSGGGPSFSGSSASGTSTYTMTSASLSIMYFNLYVYSSGCNDASNSPAQTGYIYP